MTPVRSALTESRVIGWVGHVSITPKPERAAVSERHWRLLDAVSLHPAPLSLLTKSLESACRMQMSNTRLFGETTYHSTTKSVLMIRTSELCKDVKVYNV
jgi:hypothetical protein